jgi:hypothetical protein
MSLAKWFQDKITQRKVTDKIFLKLFENIQALPLFAE